MLSPSRRLELLRGLMAARKLAALVVPSTDAHNCEYTPDRDQRRAFLTGFSGSAGTALVTPTDARLWTDGRYYLQALAQLDATCFSLMKDRLPATPSIEAFLASTLAPGECVGVDPALFPLNALRRLHVALAAKGQRLCSAPGLVDAVWGAAQPPRSAAPLVPHPLHLAGEGWPSKVARVAAALEAAGAEALAVSALDELAWLLNVRGADVTHCPVGLAYAIVHRSGEVVLAVDAGKLTPEVRAHLSQGAVRTVPYDAMAAELAGVQGRVMVDPSSTNGALYEALGGAGGGGGGGAAPAASPAPPTPAQPTPPFFNLYLPPERVVERASPIALMKAIKNATELAGFRAAHTRDALVLVRFFAWLEARVAQAGLPPISEYEAAQELDARRRAAPCCAGLSFDTIMGWRGNGAVIHYRPEPATSLPITGAGLLLCDSGGQYLDGTTDITRTLWLGGGGGEAPTAHQRRAYTAVLQGHIALSSAIFPSGTGGVALDALARAPLWAQGLDYRHGTGHGVGSYLNVHEGPQGLASVPRSDYGGGLLEGMTITDEPGYYEDGAFGVRLENILVVERAAPPCRFGGEEAWCRMAPLTCVPLGTAAVDAAQLTARELHWLNAYNAWCRDTLEPLLQGEGDAPALAWLRKESAPLHSAC